MLPRRLSSGVQYTTAGEMDRQVTIQQQNPSGDDLGGIDSYTPFATVWAKIAAITGRELYQAGQMVEEATHKIVIHYLPGITDQMTILYNGRFFKIEAVLDPDERQVEQWFLCYERNLGTAGQ